MRSEGYGTWSVCVCVSVCLSVSSYSRTTGFKATYERYQRLQNYASLKKGDFPETTTFNVKTSEKASMHNRIGLTATRSARSVYLAG